MFSARLPHLAEGLGAARWELEGSLRNYFLLNLTEGAQVFAPKLGL